MQPISHVEAVSAGPLGSHLPQCTFLLYLVGTTETDEGMETTYTGGKYCSRTEKGCELGSSHDDSFRLQWRPSRGGEAFLSEACLLLRRIPPILFRRPACCLLDERTMCAVLQPTASGPSHWYGDPPRPEKVKTHACLLLLFSLPRCWPHTILQAAGARNSKPTLSCLSQKV